MADVIFSEESITDDDQVKQGRKFFPTSAVKVNMHIKYQFERGNLTVQGTDHRTAYKLKAFLPLGDVLLVACTVLGSNNLHLLPAIL